MTISFPALLLLGLPLIMIRIVELAGLAPVLPYRSEAKDGFSSSSDPFVGMMMTGSGAFVLCICSPEQVEAEVGYCLAPDLLF